MHRRHFLSLSAAAAAGALLPNLSRADDGFREIRRGVGYFTGRGGTIGYFLADGALVVVDTQFPEPAMQCLEGLRRRSGRRIDAVVNTHHHGDHTSGNAVFRPHTDLLVAHARVPALQQAAAARQQPPGEPVVANEVFEGSWSLDLGAETMRLYHRGPAHTGGDAIVHFAEADVVHLGDLVFNRRPPVIDRPGGASIAGWIDWLEDVYAEASDGTRFIFGHAGPGFDVTGSRADVRVMRDFLEALLAYARRGYEAGQTADEVAAAEVIPGFPDHRLPDRSDSLARPLRAAYEEVSAR